MKSRLDQYLEMATKKPIEKTKGPDYSEVAYKIDKYMPDDEDVQDEYYELLDDGNVNGLAEFLMTVADEEAMYSYMPKGGTVKGLAQYLIKHR